MKGFWLFLASRKAQWFGLLLVATAVLVALAPLDPTAVLLRDQVRVQAYLIMAAVPGLALSVFLQSPGPALEAATGRRRLVLYRLGLAVVVLVGGIGVVLAGGAVSGLPCFDLWAMARNAACATGLALVLCCVLPRDGLVLVLITYGLVTWHFGVKDMFGTPYPWAVWLHEFQYPGPSELVALAAAVLGVGLYSTLGEVPRGR